MTEAELLAQSASGEVTDAKTMVALLKLQLWRSGVWAPAWQPAEEVAAAMKVLDLRCGTGHAFEGWFASEDDYGSQRERGLLDCPVCGNAEVMRLPSAPRLNLSGARAPAPAQRPPRPRPPRPRR